MAEVQTTLQDTDANGKAIKMISFVGQLDETNVDEEAKNIYQVIDEMAEPNILLDFSELAYMNSKSIGYVTDWYSKAVAKNGKIVIASPKPNILDILKVVGITQIVNIYDTIDAAKQVLGSGNAEEATAPVAETPAPPPVPAPTPAPEVSVAEPAPTPEAPVAEVPEASTVEAPAEGAEPVAVTEEPVANSEPVKGTEPVESVEPVAVAAPTAPETPEASAETTSSEEASTPLEPTPPPAV